MIVDLAGARSRRAARRGRLRPSAGPLAQLAGGRPRPPPPQAAPGDPPFTPWNLEVDVLTRRLPAMVEGPLPEASRPHDSRARDGPRPRPAAAGASGKHRTVDDYTYGGGAGMVLRPARWPEPSLRSGGPNRSSILLDPAGEVFRQATAHELARAAHLVLLCPRYEGVDERIRGWSTGSSRSATTCSPAASWPRSWSSTRSAPAAGRHRRGVDRRGVVRGRPARVPAVHPARDFAGESVPPILLAGHHEQSAAGACVSRSAARATPPRPAAGRPLSPEDQAAARRGSRRPPTGRTPLRTADTRRPPCYPPPSAPPSSACRPQQRALRSRGCRRPNSDRHRERAQRDRPDQLRTDLPVIPGDAVKVAAKVVEGNRERVQVFEGLVMRLRNSGIASHDHRAPDRLGRGRRADVQAPQPAHRPDRGRSPRRRSAAPKLYFLRDRVGKAATTLRERR